MRFVIKKALLIYYKLIRRDLKININSEISFKTYAKIKGTKEYKTTINSSILQGDVSTGYGCKINGSILSGEVKLGRFVSLNGPGLRLTAGIYGIEIGSFSSIAPNVVIQETFHKLERISTYHMSQNVFKENIKNDLYSKGRIILEEDVWVGANTVILSGVKIGRGSVVGAGSVVTKNVPRYSIVAGSPAEKIKMRFSEKIIDELEKSMWWNYDLEKLRLHKSTFEKNINSIDYKENMIFNS